MFENNYFVEVKFMGKTRMVPEGTMVSSFLRSGREDIFAMRVNNEIHSLFYKINQDSVCEPITYYCQEGERIYSRSLKYLLLMACRNVFPEIKL